MNMDKPKKITPTNQLDPDTHRTAYLRGVLEEANTQGYSVHAKGQLVVVALRLWEGR